MKVYIMSESNSIILYNNTIFIHANKIILCVYSFDQIANTIVLKVSNLNNGVKLK